MDTALNDSLNGTAQNETLVISAAESVVAYASLYGMALFCICAGSLRSAAFVQRNRDEHKLIENSITTRDAKRFPLTASAVLFSLYVFFKYGDRWHELVGLFKTHVLRRAVVDAAAAANATANATAAAADDWIGAARALLCKDNLMFLLVLMLVYEGVFALGFLLKPLFSRLIALLPLDPDSELARNLPYDLLFTRKQKDADKKGEEETKELVHWQFDTHDVVSVAVCSLVGVAHLVKRHWISNNLIGLAFSLYGIEELHLASFKGGVWLLAGLFVYDVFWVFATDVMSTVATSINAPILLMFPQDLFQNGWQAKKHAMLGLGDIVIPGIFLALLLRFDRRVGDVGGDAAAKKGGRNYFVATVFAYAAGLVLTIGVMHWFKAAQPALLYLVPACVGVPSLLAVAKGEFSSLLNYSEEHLIKKDEVKEKAA